MLLSPRRSLGVTFHLLVCALARGCGAVQQNGTYPALVLSAAAFPLVLAIFVVAIDAWVYSDAKAHADRGAPVVFRAGSFSVETPAAWFLGCLLLWVIFFPLYLNSRS